MVHLNKFNNDIAHNKYPEQGYIQCDNFKDDFDIRYGLYGIPWGLTKDINFELKYDSDNWAVVKAEVDENYIIVDSIKNRVKFHNGIVLKRDKLKKCADFIETTRKHSKHCFPDEAMSFKKEDIIGYLNAN